jgi:hypothetical protein
MMTTGWSINRNMTRFSDADLGSGDSASEPEFLPEREKRILQVLYRRYQFLYLALANLR